MIIDWSLFIRFDHLNLILENILFIPQIMRITFSIHLKNKRDKWNKQVFSFVLWRLE